MRAGGARPLGRDLAFATVTERPGTRLQSGVRRFDSGRGLCDTRPDPLRNARMTAAGVLSCTVILVPICNTCLQDKPDEEFSWRSKDRGQRQRYCKECKRQYNKSWYEQHRDEQKNRVAQRAIAHAGTRRAWLAKAKDKPCTDCGVKYPPYVMDFDHVRGSKLANVGHMATSRSWYSLRAVEEEILKCDLVCANCHRERTHQRGYRPVAQLDRAPTS